MVKEPLKKKVDEAWKDSLQKKKIVQDKKETHSDSNENEKEFFPEVNFLTHISQLAMQVMVLLGFIEHPKGEKIEINLEQANFLIKTIEMLKEKAIASLSDKEKDAIAAVLHDLRLKYLDRSNAQKEKGKIEKN